MTDDNTQAPAEGVGREDREAAGLVLTWCGFPRVGEQVSLGEWDEHKLVKIFAAHRQSAHREGVKAGLEMGWTGTQTVARTPDGQLWFYGGSEWRLANPLCTSAASCEENGVSLTRSAAQTGTGAG